MARKKSAAGTGKSEAVRSYLKVHPDAGPKQVVTDLAANGIDVSVSLVSQTKAKLFGRKAGVPRERKAAAPRAGTSAEARQAGALTATDLVEAKRLVDQLGGIAKARQALETLDELR